MFRFDMQLPSIFNTNNFHVYNAYDHLKHSL